MKYIVLLSIVMILACSTTESLAPSRQDAGPRVEASEPDVLKKYQAFYIPDIEVYSINGDVLQRVGDREVQALAEKFRSKIIQQLDSKYTMFPQPARNVAAVRIALSDVSTTYSTFQLRPGLLVPNALRGGASIEVKVVDSITNKVVMTFEDTKQGERQGYFSGLRKWDGVERAFDEWASELSHAIN